MNNENILSSFNALTEANYVSTFNALSEADYDFLCDPVQPALAEKNTSVPVLPSWTVIDTVIKDIYALDFLRIKISSRDEKFEKNEVPDRLYSSIRYKMAISIDSFADISNLMCEIMVIDEDNNLVIKTGEENVLQGVDKYTTLSKSNKSNRLEASVPVKFMSVSSHHEKKAWKFLLKFFDFSQGYMVYIFTAISTLFTVFSRKPARATKPKQVAKKRKSEADVSTSCNKKSKVEELAAVGISGDIQTSSGLTKFMVCLDQMMSIKDSLTAEEVHIALWNTWQKLFGFTPNDVFGNRMPL